MDELSYQKAFEYVELIAENTRQDQLVIKKAIKVLYNNKIKGEKAGTKLRIMISKTNKVGKLDEVFSFIKNNANYRNLSEAEINEVIKKLFSNYATDAAMILFDNVDEWAEWGAEMEKPKTIMCSNCGEELSGNDKLYVDNDGCRYCSKHCLLDSNLDREITVQEYIDEMEPWEWED